MLPTKGSDMDFSSLRSFLVPTFLFASCIFPITEQATVTTSILSEEIKSGSLAQNETACFIYHMDEATTKEVVYWQKARLLVKLDPCSGAPHLKVSVYGCPSDGHHVNWEFQSELARNDLRARGEPVPAPWEWPGDMEVLTIEVTHRRFYVEVSRYLPPLVSEADLQELEQDLNAAGKASEASDVAAIAAKNVTTLEEQARLTSYQDALLPESGFELTVTLHDAATAPREKVYPMTYAASWDNVIVEQPQIARGLRFAEDISAAFYTILFWPPTRSVNDSLANVSGAGALVANLSNLRRAAEVEEVARAGMGDVSRGGKGGEAAGASKKEEEWKRQLRETEALLEQLEARGVPEISRRLREAAAEAAAEREEAGRGGGGGGGAWRRAAGDGIGSRWLPMMASERARLPLRDADMQFQVFWTEVTAQFQEVWGTALDSSGANRTRVVDNPCVEGSAMGTGCGVRQWIARQVFREVDADGDGLMSRQEYFAKYPPEGGDSAFAAGESFFELAGPAEVLAEWQWLNAYAKSDDVLREVLKDARRRTFWTACGMRATGTLLAPSGNASEAGNPDHWFTVKDFQQLEDGRLGLAISGLEDDNNNVYMVNIVVRNNVTGEQAAFAVHTVQRRTPLYTPPEVGGSEIGLVVGVSVSAAVAVVGISVAVVLTRSKKMRPRLRVRKKE